MKYRTYNANSKHTNKTLVQYRIPWGHDEDCDIDIEGNRNNNGDEAEKWGEYRALFVIFHTFNANSKRTNRTLVQYRMTWGHDEDDDIDIERNINNNGDEA